MRLKTLALLGAAVYALKHFSDKARAEGGSLTRRQREHNLDEALDETFPASDPPSMTSPTSNTARVRSSDLKRH